MLIRRERADDILSIDAVHRAAFAREHPGDGGGPAATPAGAADPAEVHLVHRLRSDAGWMPTLSLVAELAQHVVGHVCLTRAGVGRFPVLALGPIGVLPQRQGEGIGSALMHAALGAADALDEPLVGLLGSLDYYPRFGFLPGARLGILPDEPAWVSHFQVRPLTAHEPGMTGEFRYAEPFYRP
ncbi:GNAT family N-acetyltransferase [Nocardia sp. BMG111209]|uniref:GNAT family N-acetyltransferase n=1 Tax=Nocardia sp. BMG111209 TaxID=1160137 RepID=UPI00036D9CFB|nr:N-acetyltransferase [Nocardia sp. BMG111209]